MGTVFCWVSEFKQFPVPGWLVGGLGWGHSLHCLGEAGSGLVGLHPVGSLRSPNGHLCVFCLSVMVNKRHLIRSCGKGTFKLFKDLLLFN